jgi:hypothetical protein
VMRTCFRESRKSQSKKSQRNHADAIGPPVRLRAGRKHDSIEEVAAELVLGPTKMPEQPSPLGGSSCLAHSFGSFQTDGGEVWEQLVEFFVDDPGLVARHVWECPAHEHLHYHLSAHYATVHRHNSRAHS